MIGFRRGDADDAGPARFVPDRLSNHGGVRDDIAAAILTGGRNPKIMDRKFELS